MKSLPAAQEVKLIADDKVVIETLTRIGVIDRVKKIVYPSCYLYSIDGDNYILHFKQMFMLRENSYDNLSQADILKLNAILFCLKKWNLIDIDDEKIKERESFVPVLSYAEKINYQICHKININSLAAA